MFGSLKLLRGVTTPDQYRRYRRYYCGLCQQLATDYGTAARLFLNYDTTFLYILMSSAAKAAPEPQKIRCPVAPWRPKEAFLLPAIGEFTAAATIYLAGMKLRDDLMDEGGLHRRVASWWLRQKETVAKAYFGKAGIDLERAESLYRRQGQLEKGEASLADLCRPTEEGLAYLFTAGGDLFATPADRPVLAALGAALGRVIYVLDSFVDLPTDYRCDRFNALAAALGDRAVLDLKIPETARALVTRLLREGLTTAQTQIALLSGEEDKPLLTAILASLERQVKHLVENTETLAELEAKVRTSSLVYLLTHPRLFLKSRAAARYYHYHYDRRRDRCCNNLCTLALCCEASDCDCDAAEFCASGGNPCELLECFCCG